ncbi:hypothetical protein [Planomonospora parontospora]|uniref:hypothetical protein n=1 Tax=Planomonospora parontospora TaxID=58119 RepID=UPI001E5D3694|nr:hypothetical protein [Planomonospora parontospora]
MSSRVTTAPNRRPSPVSIGRPHDDLLAVDVFAGQGPRQRHAGAAQRGAPVGGQ